MDIFRALEWYCKGTQAQYHTGETYESLVWLDKKLSKPTIEKLEAAYKQSMEDFKQKQYQRDRKKEYPSLEIQLDIMYTQGFEGWYKFIRSIKQKYPSPYNDSKTDIGSPMDELKERVAAVESKTAGELKKMHQELSDLQAAIIDTKGAIYAIKGFMMEIPNIQKALEDLKEQKKK